MTATPDPVAPWTHHRPWRNWNPGDLRPRHTNPWPGQVSIDNGEGGPFAIFASRADGWAALALWLMDAHDNRGLRSIGAMIDVFAPPSENATESYAAGVAAKLGVALDADVDVHAVPTRKALCQAIAHWEDYQALWPEAEIDSGMVLADARWPAFLAAEKGGVPTNAVANTDAAAHLESTDLQTGSAG